MKQDKDITKLEFWGASELMQAGFTKSKAYEILSRPDMPVFRIGGRLYIERKKFLAWIDAQTKVEA